MQSAHKLLGEKAQRSGVKLGLELPDDLPQIYCDPRRIKQVLVNLLSNAVKFTPGGGRVTTKAWAGADGFVIQVIDTGVGMRSEDVPRAFALFGQVDGGLNRKHEGTGLGLPLSRQLIEMHGGTLDLQSVVGAGTIVTVCLPAARLIRLKAQTDTVVVPHAKLASKRGR